jgi:hypothetical protein
MRSRTVEVASGKEITTDAPSRSGRDHTADPSSCGRSPRPVVELSTGSSLVRRRDPIREATGYRRRRAPARDSRS